jgi:hypothetical protein
VFSATVPLVGEIAIDVTLICPDPPPHAHIAASPTTAHKLPNTLDIRFRIFTRPLEMNSTRAAPRIARFRAQLRAILPPRALCL